MGKSLLRLLRENKNMTQKDVADAIGIPQSTYCLIEHGKRPANQSTVGKICALFEVEPEELFVPKRFTVRKEYSHHQATREGVV